MSNAVRLTPPPSPSAPPAIAVRRVALVGNPNSGKTTIFNGLTGSHQHVGNYPGVTVERREGQFEQDGQRWAVIDLPGTYSIAARTSDEAVTSEALLTSPCDVVVNVLDSGNLERNLYLTSQLVELGLNLVLCLNMDDEARSAGWEFDHELISRRLGGVPVVATSGHRGAGLLELRRAIAAAATRRHTPPAFGYGPELEPAVSELASLLALNVPAPALPPRFVAVRLLEGDPALAELVRRGHPRPEPLLERAAALGRALALLGGDEPAVLFADRRWGYVTGLLREVTHRQPALDRVTRSDRIDAVLTHRWLGLPIYAAVMYAVFWATFRLGEPPMRWLEAGVGALAGLLRDGWPADQLPVLRSLLADGVLGGVGGVIVFLPNILLLFLGLSLLEDTGYMARAAFLMDRLMHRIGLHGKSFVPMVIGFGCTVPAVMACRTLDSHRDRLTTMLVLPLLSCGARLPIYLLLIPAFFPPAWRAPLLMGIYLVGVLLAGLLARLLRSTLLAGEDAPFVMELPPYRLPTTPRMLRQVGQRSWAYLRKAGTTILGLSVLLWALTTYPQPTHYDVDRRLAAGEQLSEAQQHAERSRERLTHSAAGRLGRAVEPLVAPLGFDWRLATAFLGALAAKELFVAQMGIVFSLGEADERSASLRHRLAETYPPWVGLGIILFALIASPCASTLAVVRRESGSWRWVALQWFGLTALAWLVAAAVNLGGRLLFAAS